MGVGAVGGVAEVGEEIVRVLPFLVPLAILVYIYVRLRFGSCWAFLMKLRAEVREEVFGYPPEPPEPLSPPRASSHSMDLMAALLHAATPVYHRHPAAPPASSAEPATPGAPTCPVCLTNIPNAALDCGHRLCAACLAEIQSLPPPGLCPICRDQIHEVLRIYN
mmetsp:Transcript_68430/g.222637  ORF Transcript_68430/g.222637 Transcript_68430/m.222637 type:complete len:164 (-) Transcript_68430:63-554(-)